jgi:hypothetical protein
MRATAWTGSRVARGAALGISLLAGLVVLAGAGDALAQGMANPMGGSGYRSGKAAAGGYRKAARSALKGHAYRPARRAKRYGFRAAAPRTCGQFKYWSRAKGTCLDARTTPPALK